MAFYEFQNNDIVNRSYAMTLITMMIVITLIVAIVYFVLMNRESGRAGGHGERAGGVAGEAQPTAVSAQEAPPSVGASPSQGGRHD